MVMKKKWCWDCIGATTMQLTASIHGSTASDSMGELPTAENSAGASKSELASAAGKSQIVRSLSLEGRPSEMLQVVNC